MMKKLLVSLALVSLLGGVLSPPASRPDSPWVWHIETVDNTGMAAYVSLALDPAGRVHIAYYRTFSLKYAYYDGTSWHIETVDSVADVGQYTSLALDAGNVPYISYYDATYGDLKLARRVGTGGNCGPNGSWRCETIDTTGDVGRYTSLALAGAGWATAKIAHTGEGLGLGNHLYYTWYNNVEENWVSTVVDTSLLYPWNGVSMALDAAKRPHIAYGNASALKYAYYDGASWHIETVTSDTQGYVSLALDPAGRVHIAYFSEPNLRYAWRDAGGVWHQEVVDSSPASGLYTSLSLSSDLPHIAYVEYDSGNLKYAYACVDAHFSAAPVPQCVFQPVQFDNESRGVPPLSFLWAFGDGTTSTETNPFHTYTAAGRYTAVLTATAPCGLDRMTATVVISSTPTADFSFGTLPVCAGRTTQFTNTTVGSATLSFLWDFDDGSSSTLEHPTHTYALPGTYDVVLIAMNGCGVDTQVHPVQAHGSPHSPDFTVQPDPPLQSRPATFTGSAESTLPVSYTWSFGDGSGGSGSPITHVYTTTGMYTVTLTATNACGMAKTTGTVSVMALPVAGFESNSPICLGEPAVFTNTSDPGFPPARDFFWDFGDGITSTVENPTHTYAASGLYTVTFRPCNAVGCDEAEDTFQVLPLPAAAFTYTTAGLVVTFTNASQNAGAFLWDFGDGITSTIESPTHAYASEGAYTVTLTATGSCGRDTAVRVVRVETYRIYLPLVDKARYGGDAYEPDNTPAQARPLPPEVWQEHTVYPAGDTDWMWVELSAQVPYTFETDFLGPGTDTVLSVYAPDGTTLLAQNDDCTGFTRRSCLVFSPGQGGLYYVRVQDYRPDQFGPDHIYSVRYYGGQ
ncbi:MAG: PKD domain-containing protein [Chloroflexia bacterium]